MKSFKGPKAKIVRRFGINIFESPKYGQILEKRPTPPGAHGAKRKKSKISEYGKQLFEKQKIKFTYGMTEKQFRKFYDIASSKKGPKGENLLILLERKLDNVIFRCGFASTRAQAKQLVSHSHVLVNGRKNNIPSMVIKAGDKVSIRSKKSSLDLVTNYIGQNDYREVAGWLNVDKNNKSAEVVRFPEFSEIPLYGDPQMIVELYSK